MAHRSYILTQHLAKEHRISPLQTYLKEIVYGGSDGIVTTFAVVAGFTGASAGGSALASLSFATLFLFGFANLFADAASMGLGNFLSLRSEKDVYKKEQEKERHEVKHDQKGEKEETIMILKEQGFSDEQARKLTDIYATNEKYWVSFMMNYELELPNPIGENPFLTGLATFLSFIVFGFIPLSVYFATSDIHQAFVGSCIATFSALVLLGLLRFRVTGENIIRSVSEIVAIGGTSAVIAYTVGTFFRI